MDLTNRERPAAGRMASISLACVVALMTAVTAGCAIGKAPPGFGQAIGDAKARQRLGGERGSTDDLHPSAQELGSVLETVGHKAGSAAATSSAIPGNSQVTGTR